MKQTLPIVSLLLLTLLAVLLLTPAASAVSAQEWNAQCTSKMSSGATVYHIVPVTATSTDISDGSTALKSAGSVSAGAYVKRGGSITVNGTAYCSITYLNGGSTASGYVKQSLVRSATVSRYINATQRISVPEVIANDASAIYTYAVSKGYNADLNAIRSALGQAPVATTPAATTPGFPTPIPTAPVTTPASTVSSAPVWEDEPTPTPTLSPVPQAGVAFYVDFADPVDVSDGSDTEPQTVQEKVDLIGLGTINTTIRFRGKKIQIPTSQLQCNQPLDPDHALAVVTVPDAGSIFMHTRESTKSGIVRKVNHGSIVLVLKVGSKTTYVWYKDKSGYIENSALRFYPLAAAADQDLPQPARLSYKGKTDGKHTLSLLMKAKSGSRTIAKFKSGTYTDVFSSPREGWYEVEVGGVRGFIQQKYVTLDEASISNP